MKTLIKTIHEICSYMIILLLALLNYYTFAEKITKPNEIGPWPNIQVNTYTGNLFYERNDLFIPNRGEIPLSIDFWYNSLKTNEDFGYGNGWSFSFGMHYTYQEDLLTIYREEGQEDIFTWDGSVFVPPVGVYDQLTVDAPGSYLLRTKYGIKYYFENASHKKLTKIEDRNGNTTTLTYTGSKLTTITDPSGRMLNLSWADDLLVQITDPNTTPARIFTFTYDENRNLVQVVRPLNNTWQYGYDANNNMTSANDPNGNTATITYDVNDAVTAISCLAVNYNKNIVYDNNNNTTTVSQIVSTVNRQTIYTFDLAGRLISTQFPDGNAVFYSWDSQSNLTAFTNEIGSTTIITYDSKGNLLGETDCLLNSSSYTYESNFNKVALYQNKNGFQTQYNYDVNGNLISRSDCYSKTEVFTYDAFGNLVTFKNKNNQTTTYTYDIYGNQTGLTDPLSFSETKTFDQVGNMLTTTDKRGFITTYVYDALNRNTLITDAINYTRNFIRDANGNLTGETNQNGQTTLYAYDATNRLVQKTDASGGMITLLYDEAGNVISETNARGYNTTHMCNSRNWLIRTTDCKSNFETYSYSPSGFRLTSKDKSGNTTSYIYDCLGQLVQITDPGGYTDNYTYDAAGNQTSYKNKNGVQTFYTYDGLNRLSSINYPLAYSETFAYDAESNQTVHIDKNGQATSYSYDALNRLTTKTDPLAKTESKTYDGAGNIASSTDKNGNTTIYSYDPLGRLILKTDPVPLGYTQSFSYDGVGNLLASTDRRGNTTTYQYDNLNRQTLMITPMGYTEISSYDENGNLVAFNNKNGFTTTYAYDCRDLMTLGTDPLNFNESYTYNSSDQKTGYTDKKGGATTWSYSCCRMTSTTDPLLFTEYYGYDPVGNKTSLTNKNGNTTTYAFDALDRLITITTPMLSQTSLTLDGNGNILTKTDGNLNTITYTYNARGDLITTLYPDATSITYTYDNNGDLLQTVNTGGIGETITYTYDETGRVNSKATNYGAFTKTIEYTYDQNGNTLSVTTETGAITHIYDNDNRVIQITDQNEGVTTFQYDGMGNQTVVNYPNGISTYSSYDANGNVISVVTQTTPPLPPPAGKQASKGVIAIPESNREILFDTDLAVTDILSPLSGMGLGEEPVTIVITNYGTLPVTMFEASYFIGGEGFVQLVEMFINPAESVVFTFLQYADLSDPGDYLIETCVNLMGDEFPDNNCMIALITNEMPLITYDQFIYDYDANGNKIVESRLDATTSFLGYSERDELISEFNTGSASLTEYTYYPSGQRQTISINGIVNLYSYNPDGALLSAGGLIYTSDENGNRTSMTESAGYITTYSYSYDNELIQAAYPDLSEVQYFYSALGDPLKRIENMEVTYYHYNGGQLLNEFDESGNPTYYYNPDISIMSEPMVMSLSENEEFPARSTGQKSPMTNDTPTAYYYYNGFGNTTLQVDNNKAVVAKTTCDAIGSKTGSIGNWINDRRAFNDLVHDQKLTMYKSQTGNITGNTVFDPFADNLLNVPILRGFSDPVMWKWIMVWLKMNKGKIGGGIIPAPGGGRPGGGRPGAVWPGPLGKWPMGKWPAAGWPAGGIPGVAMPWILGAGPRNVLPWPLGGGPGGPAMPWPLGAGMPLPPWLAHPIKPMAGIHFAGMPEGGGGGGAVGHIHFNLPVAGGQVGAGLAGIPAPGAQGTGATFCGGTGPGYGGVGVIRSGIFRTPPNFTVKKGMIMDCSRISYSIMKMPDGSFSLQLTGQNGAIPRELSNVNNGPPYLSLRVEIAHTGFWWIHRVNSQGAFNENRTINCKDPFFMKLHYFSNWGGQGFYGGPCEVP